MTDTRLAVFDVDGTLVDSQHHIVAAMTAAFAAIRAEPPARAAVLSIVGLSLPVAVARLAPDLQDPDYLCMIDAYKVAWMAAGRGGSAPLYPGAAQVLAGLGALPGVVMGVATGKSRKGLDHLMAVHDLTRHFATVQVADDHPSKPHPAMLLAALAETGIDPRRAVMIGDTTYDMAMARAAGMRALGVGWGYHPVADLRDAGAERIVAQFDEVPAALDAMWGEGA